ncbi:unnamed protein product [Prorocentrum cordatum]|uniref:Uncharacterized protein n=1 Tax=Prorocentrum cordatum TaxID=2364126 RepID=A0ABN9PNA3_9DINO|nr:unnamed protein product [Polarella glacialis]
MGKRGDHNAKPPQKVPCGQGRRRRGSQDASAAAAHSAASALARLAAPDSFQCGTCDVTDVSMAVQDATAPTCTTCFDRYCKGFTQFGSLEKVQEGVNEEGSHIHGCWEESKRIEKGEAAKSFFPTAVNEGSQFIIAVVKPMVGITRGQLVSDVLHEEPEALGIKLQDLPDHEGNTYKGILVPNPQRPYLEYNVTNEIYANMIAHKMTPDQQTFDAQALGTYDHLSQGLSTTGHCRRAVPPLVKARTEAYTIDSLIARAENYRKTQAEIERRAKEAEDAAVAASGESSFGGSPSPAAPQQGALAAGSGPQLNPAAMACSRSVVAPSECRPPRTPGARPRGGARSVMSDAKKSEVEELVDRRISALDTSSCWSGAAMGRELRWARESHEGIMEASPTPEDSETADKLKEHISVCDAICGFVEKPLREIPKSKLDSFLNTLEKYNEDMPSKWKLDNLKVGDLLKKPDMCMQDFFYMVAPWEVQHAEGNGSLTYRPTYPRVITLDGSQADKISQCDAFFTEALNHHIHAGEGGRSQLVQFCTSCLDWIDNNCPEDEAFDDVVNTMAQCLKALLCIASPGKIAYHDSITKMGEAKSQCPGQACLRHLNLSVKRSEFYTSLRAVRDECAQYYTKTQEHWPEVCSLLSKMEQCKTVAGFVQSGNMAIALNKVAMFAMYCRPGSIDGFKSKLTALFEKYLADLPQGDPSNDPNGKALTARLAETKALVTAAKIGLPEKHSVWAKALSDIQKQESSVNKFNASQGLGQLASALNADALADDAARLSVIPVIESVLAAGGRGVEAHRGSGAAIFQHVLDGIAMNCTQPDHAESYCDILLKLAEAEWLTDASGTKLKAATDMIKNWAPLNTHVASWDGLASDDESRLRHGNAKNIIQGMIATLKAIKSAGMVSGMGGLETDATNAGQKTETASWPISRGGDDEGDPWDCGMPDGNGGIEEVLERAFETIMLIDGSAYQEKIDAVQHAFEEALEWSEVFEYQVDTSVIDDTNKVLWNAMATKYTALLIHTYKENSSNPPKLRREINNYRKQIKEQSGVEKAMRQDVMEWASKMCSLKG